jgi:FkbM family methyltransferase
LRRVLPTRAFDRYAGRHEDESLRLWQVLAREAPKDSSIVDIGAYVGEFSIAAREVNQHARIWAFEPNPDTAETVAPTCQQYSVDFVEGAMAEYDGETTFVCDREMSRLGSLAVSSGERANHETKTSVQAVSLDSWATKNGERPFLIKIDTEGGEGGILRGGKQVLRQHSPLILCEVLTDEAGREVMAALPDHYRYFEIDENRNAQERDHIFRRRWRDKNWLLVPGDYELPQEANCVVLSAHAH